MKPRDAAYQARIEQALHLRASGHTYEQIGATLGIGKAGAHKVIQKALARNEALSVSELREIELQRLDALHAAIWAMACPDEKKKKPNLHAIDRLLKISHQRCLLLGLYPKGEAPHPPHVIVRCIPNGYLSGDDSMLN